MEYDVKVLKDCGFNMLRKHIKVESQQYYAMCDRIGILVVQDLPSGSDQSHDPMKPCIVKRYHLQRQEMKEMMDILNPFACIVMWSPYNEGWTQPGEFLTHSMLDFTRRYDPTRLVNGRADVGTGKADTSCQEAGNGRIAFLRTISRPEFARRRIP